VLCIQMTFTDYHHKAFINEREKSSIKSSKCLHLRGLLMKSAIVELFRKELSAAFHHDGWMNASLFPSANRIFPLKESSLRQTKGARLLLLLSFVRSYTK